MINGRRLLVAASLMSVVASVGLAVFGPSVVRVMGVAGSRGPAWQYAPGPSSYDWKKVDWDEVDRQDKVLALGYARDLGPAAASAALFGAAAVVLVVGALAVRRSHPITHAGRALMISAGAVAVLSAVPVMLGIIWAQRRFGLVASCTVVKAPLLDRLISEIAPWVTFGFLGLALSQTIALTASLVGFGPPPPAEGKRTPVAIVGGAAATSALLFAGLFAANWLLHSHALASTMSRFPGVRCAALAGDVASIMWNGQVAALCPAILGVMLVMLGVSLPGRRGHAE